MKTPTGYTKIYDGMTREENAKNAEIIEAIVLSENPDLANDSFALSSAMLACELNFDCYK